MRDVLRAAAVLFGLIAGGIGVAIGSSELYRAAGPDAANIAVAALLVGASLPVTGGVLLRWRRSGRRSAWPVVWVTVIGLSWTLLGLAAGLPRYRAMCGAWALSEGTTVRGVIQTMTEQVRNGDSEALNPTEVFMQLGAGRLVDQYCGCLSSRELSAGSLTYADVRSGRVTEVEFINAVRSASDPEQPWERLGIYVFSRDRRALGSYSPAVIVAYSLPPPGCGTSWMVIGFADNHIEALDLTNLNIIEHSLAEMRANGFPLPPDDLVAHARARGAGLK